MSNNEQKTGVIKHWDSEKKFGFIKPNVGKEDIFFHVSETNYDVEKGDEVSYEIGQGKRGDMAINITQL